MKRTTMKAGARRRTTGLVSLAAAATLVLSACGGDDSNDDGADNANQEQGAENEGANEGANDETGDEDAAEDTADGDDDAAETTAEETTEEDETTEEPAGDDVESTEDAGDDAGGGAGGDFTTAEAGTTLAFGETGTLHVQDFDEGHEYYAFGYVESTVTGVTEGDASFFDQFDDTEEYEGMTPYFITGEHEILHAEGYERGSNLEPTFEGVLDDGTPAQGLIVIGITGVEECQEERFEEWVTGATATSCDIALAPEGQSVTGAVWTGDREIDGGWDENPYLEAPISWE